MCKVLGFSNSSKLDVVKAANVIGSIMNELEQDGFGYAVSGKNGVYGEKYVQGGFMSLYGANEVSSSHIAFGKRSKPVGASIWHGRTSTNDRGLRNCHPIQRSEWHLIHNGVVTDHGEKYAMLTTNDSEHVLHRLTLGIDQVESHLTGYYAFLAIDPTGRLHIGKDCIAGLYMAWSDTIESFIFGTTESLIASVCKGLEIEIGKAVEVKNDSYYIMQGNETVHAQEIKSRGYGFKESQYASLSLGRELDDYHYQNPYDADIDAYEYELGSLDDTYEIFDKNLNEITTREFYQLDYLDQEQCLIFRADGSAVELREEAI